MNRQETKPRRWRREVAKDAKNNTPAFFIRVHPGYPWLNSFELIALLLVLFAGFVFFRGKESWPQKTQETPKSVGPDLPPSLVLRALRALAFQWFWLSALPRRAIRKSVVKGFGLFYSATPWLRVEYSWPSTALLARAAPSGRNAMAAAQCRNIPASVRCIALTR